LTSNGVGVVPLQASRRTAMDHYAGIDVPLECSNVCLVDASGPIAREGKVATEPPCAPRSLFFSCCLQGDKVWMASALLFPSHARLPSTHSLTHVNATPAYKSHA